jgi:hypothetical protein
MDHQPTGGAAFFPAVIASAAFLGPLTTVHADFDSETLLAAKLTSQPNGIPHDLCLLRTSLECGLFTRREPVY